MKTLIAYYSYSGHTKTIAEALAEGESADVAQIKDVKRPGKFKAYTAGILAAGRGKAWPIEEPVADFAGYDRLILLAPIWAGNPAPPFNAMLERLPEGKTVAVKMVSMTGKSGCKERVEAVVKARGCTFEGYEDVKGTSE